MVLLMVENRKVKEADYFIPIVKSIRLITFRQER